MNEELENRLKVMSPEFLRELHGDVMKTCMHFGFECGDGWYKPLEKLCLKAQEMNTKMTDMKVVAKQIKSKFGMLCVYYDIVDEDSEKDIYERPRVPRSQIEEKYKEFFLAVSKAMSECEDTCEICGSTDDCDFSHYTVRCKKCREERHRRDTEKDTEKDKEKTNG